MHEADSCIDSSTAERYYLSDRFVYFGRFICRRTEMPKIFTEDERYALRTAMFEKGFELLKKDGMTHMSVEKITAACNLGKSTFYNFFDSKEHFVTQLIEYRRNKALQTVRDRLGSRQKMTVSEGKQLLKQLAGSSESIYRYLKPEDIGKLQKNASYLHAPDLEEERSLLAQLFSYMEGIRKDPDYALIANMMKMIALASEQKEMFHMDAYEGSLDALYRILFEQIFEEESQ